MSHSSSTSKLRKGLNPPIGHQRAEQLPLFIRDPPIHTGYSLTVNQFLILSPWELGGNKVIEGPKRSNDGKERKQRWLILVII